MSFLRKNNTLIKLSIALFSALVVSACSSQKKITVQYIGQQFTTTQNKSFLNNELLLLKGKDTIRMNVKLPYNSLALDTINNGILYRCFLKQNTLYTFKLKPICPEAIPDAVNSYYKINAVSSKRKCSTFSEIKKDTEFMYRNPGKYIDIDHKIYEIMELWPDKDCAFE